MWEVCVCVCVSVSVCVHILYRWSVRKQGEIQTTTVQGGMISEPHSVVHELVSTSNLRVLVCVHQGGSRVGGGFRPIIKEFSPFSSP